MSHDFLDWPQLALSRTRTLKKQKGRTVRCLSAYVGPGADVLSPVRPSPGALRHSTAFEVCSTR